MRKLAGLLGVGRALNVFFEARRGADKTHRAIGFGVKACKAGHRVLFSPWGSH